MQKTRRTLSFIEFRFQFSYGSFGNPFAFKNYAIYFRKNVNLCPHETVQNVIFNDKDWQSILKVETTKRKKKKKVWEKYLNRIFLIFEPYQRMAGTFSLKANKILSAKSLRVQGKSTTRPDSFWCSPIK